ncbi:MAG: DinB family protein [Planctomycetes bacterium]|nr:DinB family protein [Planctomycetota bacterium]
MHTHASLFDIHTRSHQSLVKLMDHCAGFSDDELAREVEGFGYPCIRLQLHHVIGAEQYWVGVLHGLMLVDELEEDYASIDALRAFRERVAGVTHAYLQTADEAELNTARKMTTFGGHERELVPAHIILRTQTHIFQHQGQVGAMCRLLGRPIPPGLDFPVQ